jgi:hypothetical protein
MKTKDTTTLRIGWASVDITPAEPVQLAGQFHVRISEDVRDPVTATALALAAGDAEDAGAAIVLVSCDLVTIPDSLRDSVRARVAAAEPGLDPRCIVLNATHTHTAPEVRVPEDFELLGGGISSAGIDISLPAMDPRDYTTFAATRIAGAVIAAWRDRAPGAIGYGLGHAVIGHNRRIAYDGGVSRMYGDTAADGFSHIEGYEDHDVNLLATWNGAGTLTGLAVNVACPAQVSESEYRISADYWHETREVLRRRLGDELFVLPQCSAAGDQSPHVQWRRAAEARMLRLTGQTERQAIATRIADAVEAVLPAIAGARTSDAALHHVVETVELSRRRLSEADVAEAQAQVDDLRATYERLKRELAEQPELRGAPRWYVDVTRSYRRMAWWQGVVRRFEMEKTAKTLPIEAHVVRLGDVAIATNPFEYYLDFGVRIKARSPAVQTFVVQLTGAGTYVPTERAVAGKSYGAIPASTPVGPAGGRELVEWTVRALRDLWATVGKQGS